MKEYLKNISLFLVIGIILQGISVLIESDFLSKFLDENLITLLLALLAINTTTMSVIMTKLREITEKNKVDFRRTIKSMKSSIIEQVILVILAGLVLLVKGSTRIVNNWSDSIFVFNVLLIGIFAYAIDILYDTANGVFVILRHENRDLFRGNKPSSTLHKLVSRNIDTQNDIVKVEATCSCGFLMSAEGSEEGEVMKIIISKFEEHNKDPN